MSLQSRAKELQGYATEQRGCGNCAHFQSDFVLPVWMVEHNAQIDAGGYPGSGRYDIANPNHRKEVKMRCGIGGFAVKKTASCERHEAKTT